MNTTSTPKLKDSAHLSNSNSIENLSLWDSYWSPLLRILSFFSRHLEAELYLLPFPLNTDGCVMVLLGIILIVIVRTCYAFSTSWASDADPFLVYQSVLVPSYISQFWERRQPTCTVCSVAKSGHALWWVYLMFYQLVGNCKSWGVPTEWYHTRSPKVPICKCVHGHHWYFSATQIICGNAHSRKSMHSNIFQERQEYEEFKRMQFQLSYLMNSKCSFKKKLTIKLLAAFHFTGANFTVTEKITPLSQQYLPKGFHRKQKLSKHETKSTAKPPSCQTPCAFIEVVSFPASHTGSEARCTQWKLLMFTEQRSSCIPFKSECIPPEEQSCEIKGNKLKDIQQHSQAQLHWHQITGWALCLSHLHRL